MGSVPFGSFMFPYGCYGNLGFGGGGGGEGGLVSASPLVVEEEGRGKMAVGGTSKLREGDGKVSDMRSAMALRSHCEAERRRRERINSHLDSLRSFVPTANKLDKATLLAEVIDKVRELKTRAAESDTDHNLPSDSDELRVEEGDMGGGAAAPDGSSSSSGSGSGGFTLKATICCEDRPEVLADLKQTLKSLKLRVVGAEISVLEGRVRNVLLVSCGSDTERRGAKSSLLQALQAVLDRVNSQVEFDPRTLVMSGKRRRVSILEESVSSISSF